jgi:hypothetical protein
VDDPATAALRDELRAARPEAPPLFDRGGDETPGLLEPSAT